MAGNNSNTLMDFTIYMFKIGQLLGINHQAERFSYCSCTSKRKCNAILSPNSPLILDISVSITQETTTARYIPMTIYNHARSSEDSTS